MDEVMGGSILVSCIYHKLELQLLVVRHNVKKDQIFENIYTVHSCLSAL